MKNKHKVFLVKFVISLGAVLSIIAFILSVILGIQSRNNLENLFYEKMLALVFSLAILDGIIMVMLMCKIDIRPEKTKPVRLKLKDNDYEIIKKTLCEKYEQKGYKELVEYEYDEANISYMIKQNQAATNLIIFIKIEELTEEIMYGFEEQIYAKQILNLEDIEPKDKLDIIYIVIVNKVTSIFTKYTERNIKQTFWLTTLPIGISLASKTIYISTQEESFSILRYKKMKKQFITDINDMLEK